MDKYKDFLQHKTSGDVFAVEWEPGKNYIVSRSYGPVPQSECYYRNLANFDYTDEDNAWFNDTDEFRLLELL